MNSLIKYLKNSRAELAKVSWPSRKLTIKYTVEVLIVSAFIGLFLAIIDIALVKLLDSVL